MPHADPEKRREYRRTWRLKNSDLVKAKFRAWYEANKGAAEAQKKEWRSRNPEKVRATKKRWADRNRQYLNDKSRSHYQENKAEKLAYSKAYRQANAARIAASGRAWRQANKDRRVVVEQLRRARKRAAPGKFFLRDVEQMYDAQDGMCSCGAHLVDGFHIDHIVPLSRNGSNWPDNLQLLCPKCNLSKGNRLPFDKHTEKIMARSEDVKTPLARVAFADTLFTPQARDNGKKQYGCSLLWPKGTDLTKLKEAALAAATEEWGDKAVQMIKDEIIKTPFLDGDSKQGKNKSTGEPHAGFPGTTFIRVISGEEYRPKLVNQKVLPITSKDELYSGCYGYAVVNAFTWENKENGKGISFGISMLQKAKDGERLGGGGGGNPEEHFEKIADEGEAPESTKSGKGAEGLFD